MKAKQPPKASPIKPGIEATSKYSTSALTTTADMSKQEMLQIIESQKKEIQHLSERVKELESENDQMVDNFKLSSSVLLERLKDLE